MSTRVEVLNEVTTPDSSPEGTWNLALQRCRYVNDEGGSTAYGFRFIWRDQHGDLRSAAGQARLHSLNLVRELLRKAEVAGWGGHDANVACDSRQPTADAGDSSAGEVKPQGALSLIGAWGEIDDQHIDAMVEDIYAARRRDTGRHVELED